jgi:hypothetical protein
MDTANTNPTPGTINEQMMAEIRAMNARFTEMMAEMRAMQQNPPNPPTPLNPPNPEPPLPRLTLLTSREARKGGQIGRLLTWVIFGLISQETWASEE